MKEAQSLSSHREWESTCSTAGIGKSGGVRRVGRVGEWERERVGEGESRGVGEGEGVSKLALLANKLTGNLAIPPSHQLSV